MIGQVATPLPSYRCHKEVWALKIKEIQRDTPLTTDPPADEEEPGATIVPVELGYAPFPVTAEFMRKHRPMPGGYWVVYKDGYQSFSPAQAFEEGYTKI